MGSARSDPAEALGADPVVVSVAAYTPVAAAYEAAHEGKMADRVERFTGSLPPGSRVLDAGCGPGRDLARLVAAGYAAVGVDLNPVFVERAGRHAPTLLLDLRELDHNFAPGSFDGIWASASLVHLSETEVASVLRQFATILRPGGRVYVCVHRHGETGWWDEHDGRRFYTVWRTEDFSTALTDAGLVLEAVEADVMVEVWARSPGARAGGGGRLDSRGRTGGGADQPSAPSGS